MRKEAKKFQKVISFAMVIGEHFVTSGWSLFLHPWRVAEVEVAKIVIRVVVL